MNNRSNLLGGEFTVVQYWTGAWETEGEEEEVGRRCEGEDTGDGLSVVAASGWWLDQAGGGWLQGLARGSSPPWLLLADSLEL